MQSSIVSQRRACHTLPLSHAYPRRPIVLRRSVTTAAQNSATRPPENPLPTVWQRAAACALGSLAAAALALTAVPPAALAEIQTVPVDQVTAAARPLKMQTVNKGRVWLIFILGASSLFGVTVLSENNESWFPAISRANKAMAASVKVIEERERAAAAEQAQFEARLQEVQEERSVDARLESAVLAGLSDAAKRSPVAAAAPIAAAAAKEEEGEDEGESEDERSDVSAAGKDINANSPRSYPAELSSTEDEEETAAASSKDEEEEGKEGKGDSLEAAAAEAGVADGFEEEEVSSSAAASAEQRKPLFVIDAEQIEASVKSVAAAGQRGVLSEVSAEDLQRELERRAAAAVREQSTPKQ